MRKLQPLLARVFSLGVLLGGCAGGGDQPTTSVSPVPATEPSSAAIAESPGAASPMSSPEAAAHAAPEHGGQVVETGAYHLELVAIPEATGTHLDLFLQTGDTHEPVAGATVTGQIQLPDGSGKTLDFEYDAAGEHYVGLLSESMTGEYKVVILTDIQGEKVNARFSFRK